MNNEPKWLPKELALEIHDKIIAASGGSNGVRDLGLLESALSRPANVFAYEDADIFDLAAVYAEAIAHNHPFIDGNKRTSFAMAGLFLELNGYMLNVAEYTEMMVAIAEKKISREEVAAHFRQYSVPIITTQH